MKAMDVVRDICEAILHRKMPGFEPMHLGLRKISQVCLSTLASEKDIVLSPENDRRRLMLPEKLLPLRIQRDVIAVVVEEIKLDLPPVRLLQRGVVIGVPVVWTDQFGQFRAVQIYSLDGVIFQQARDSCFVFRGPVVPESVTQATPSLGKADLVSISVLDNQPLEHLWFARHNAKANRPSVVLRVKTEAVKALLLEEVLDDFGQLVEGIGELQRVGSITAAKARIVWGNDVKAIGKRWNEIAVLM